MLKSRLFAVAPAVLALAAAACSADLGMSEGSDSVQQADRSGGGEGTGGSGHSSGGSSSSSSSSSGGFALQLLELRLGRLQLQLFSSSSSGGRTRPLATSGANDAQQRAVTLRPRSSIMKAAAASPLSASNAQSGANGGGPCFATDHSHFTAALHVRQRQQHRSSSTRPTRNTATCPQAAKVALAIAQLDSTRGVVPGLRAERGRAQNTTGHWLPVAMPVQALASFTYPGNSTPIKILDGAAGGNRRSEVVTGSAWCNTQDIHFVGHVDPRVGLRALHGPRVLDGERGQRGSQLQGLERHTRRRRSTAPATSTIPTSSSPSTGRRSTGTRRPRAGPR